MASKRKGRHAHEGKHTHTLRPTKKVGNFKRAGFYIQGWDHFSRSLTALADWKSGPITKHTEKQKLEQDIATAPTLGHSARSPAWHVPGAYRPTPQNPSKGLKSSGQPADSRANISVASQAISKWEERGHPIAWKKNSGHLLSTYHTPSKCMRQEFPTPFDR